MEIAEAIAGIGPVQLRAMRRVFKYRRMRLIRVRDGKERPTAFEIDLVRHPAEMDRTITRYGIRIDEIRQALRNAT